MSEVFIIVGAGHCGGHAAAALRQQGFAGRVVVIGQEPHPPYQRPPLSKAFLAGELPVERVYLRPATFYVDNHIELLLGTRVIAIHRADRRIVLADGTLLTYDKLLLATGSVPRRLEIPGADLSGVHYLRNLADADRIRAHLAPEKSMVVVGGGYIGLEVAAIARKLGMQVTLLEATDRILNRVTTPQISDFFAQLHGEHGVGIRCNARVLAFEGRDQIQTVVCDDARLAVDVVLVAIGILPDVALAQAAGLECDNGIIVDEHCRTADEHIYAAGDCTNHPNPLLQRRLRLESVHNAVEQGKTAALNMCGEHRPYADIPWFWSDQYDVKLQTAGLSDGYDQVVQRGNIDKRAFSLFYLKDGVLIAVDAINNPREYMACRKLVPRQLRIPPARLADTTIAMQEMA